LDRERVREFCHLTFLDTDVLRYKFSKLLKNYFYEKSKKWLSQLVSEIQKISLRRTTYVRNNDFDNHYQHNSSKDI
jgi:ribosomal protein S18